MDILRETLQVHSVENFITEKEKEDILTEIERLIKNQGKEVFEAGYNDKSVHTIDNYTKKETVNIYEPNGRIEITELPQNVISILDNAVNRNLESINLVFPNAKKADCWIYFEYEKDQYITPHIDYSNNLDRENIKYTNINLLLSKEDNAGGEFFVETTGDLGMWEDNKIKNGAHSKSDWFNSIAKTRWVSQQSPLDAIFCGTQLTHGTLPVKKGKIKKIVGFLTN